MSNGTLAIIRFLAAIFAGISAYFFTGGLGLEAKIPFSKTQLKATGAFAAFIVVLLIFFYGIPNIPQEMPPSISPTPSKQPVSIGPKVVKSPLVTSSINAKGKDSVLNSGGWWAEYYLGDFREHVKDGELLGQTQGGYLSKEWGEKDGGGPPELGRVVGNFSARFHARRALEEGTYIFKIFADDRSRLKIDGNEIHNAWHPGSFEQMATYKSTGGVHDIQIDYMNDSFVAYLKVEWKKLL